MYSSSTSGSSSSHSSFDLNSAVGGQTVDTGKDTLLSLRQRESVNFNNLFYRYDVNDLNENSVLRDNLYNTDLGLDGYYAEKSTLEHHVENSEMHREAIDSFSDGNTRHLSETMSRINSAIETVSKQIHSLRDFVKERTDLFTNEGEESDYLFSPCQDSSAIKANSLYGFVVSTWFVLF